MNTFFSFDVFSIFKKKTLNIIHNSQIDTTAAKFYQLFYSHQFIFVSCYYECTMVPLLQMRKDWL